MKLKNKAELMNQAILLCIDEPDISNSEVARQIGVSEGVIRQWKKNPKWEEQREKMIAVHKEAVKKTIASQADDYIKRMDEQQKKLEIFRNAVESSAAKTLQIANSAANKLLLNPNPIAACDEATRIGIHTQLKAATETLKALESIYDKLNQYDVIKEFIKNGNIVAGNDYDDDEYEYYDEEE